MFILNNRAAGCTIGLLQDQGFLKRDKTTTIALYIFVMATLGYFFYFFPDVITKQLLRSANKYSDMSPGEEWITDVQRMRLRYTRSQFAQAMVGKKREV